MFRAMATQPSPVFIDEDQGKRRRQKVRVPLTNHGGSSIHLNITGDVFV